MKNRMAPALERKKSFFVSFVYTQPGEKEENFSPEADRSAIPRAVGVLVCVLGERHVYFIIRFTFSSL